MKRAENTTHVVAPAMTLHNLTVSYRRHPALHHVSGRFARGTLTAVIGPNGAGKSTLLKSLAGLVKPEPHGYITRSPNVRLAYLPQHSALDTSFPLDVRDCVLMGLWPQTSAWGSTTPAMLAHMEAALEAVGLQDFERRPVGTLSSGQLQRTLFARLLVQDADIILLDEPFNAIDSKTTDRLLTLIRQWQRQGRTVVAALHDNAQVREYFEQTLLLARGCVAWGATAEVLTETHLQRARTMAEAWDETAAICDIDTRRTQRLAATP
jgi:zinc/manganese transport system ATP-binding protein